MQCENKPCHLQTDHGSLAIIKDQALFICPTCAASLQYKLQEIKEAARRSALSRQMSQDPKVRERMATARASRRSAGPKISELAYEAIKQGFDFEKTKDFIRTKRPDSQFSKACYCWYKNKLKKGV